jgi:hypothetical protein
MNKQILHVTLGGIANSSRIQRCASFLFNDKRYFNDVIFRTGDTVSVDFLRHQIKVDSTFFRTWWANRFQIVKLLIFLRFTLRLIKTNRYDVVIVHNYPLLILFTCIGKNTVKIFDAHELETEVTGLSGLRKYLSKIYEYVFVRHADTVWVVSPMIFEWYKRYRVAPDLRLVMNIPEFYTDEVKGICELKPKDGVTKFVYHGILSRGRSIEKLISVFQNAGLYHCELHIYGFGELESLVADASKQNSNIFYHGTIPRNELKYHLSSHDIGISLIEAINMSNEYSLPNKFFDYVYNDIPVLVYENGQQGKLADEYSFIMTIPDVTAKHLCAIRDNYHDMITFADFNRFKNRFTVESCYEEITLSLSNKHAVQK